jgi:hypothetical protein
MGIDRIIAALLALVCIAGLVYLNKQVLFPAEGHARAGTNPEYTECRAQRLADVQKMRDDGMIDDAKFAQFSDRAIALCAAQFPPNAG